MKISIRLAALSTAGVLLLAGCGNSSGDISSPADTPVVLTVEDTDVSASQLAWQMEEGRQQMEGEYNSLMGQLEDTLSTETPAINAMWRDKKLRGVLREYGTNQILKDFARQKLIEENHLTLTAEEEKAVQDVMDYGISYAGSEKNFIAGLAQNGKTEDSFRQEQEAAYYDKKIQALYYGKDGLDAPKDSEITDYYHKHYYHFVAISLPFSKDKEMSSRDKALLKREADSLREQLAGDHTDAIPASLKTGQTYQSYTVDSTADLNSLWLSTIAKLKENETSEILSDDDGYYILRRFPLEDTLLTAENYSTDGTDLLWNEISYKLHPVDDLLTAKSENLDVQKHPAYYTIKNTNYQKYLV